MYNYEEARTIIAGRTNLRVALNDKEILLRCKGKENYGEKKGLAFSAWRRAYMGLRFNAKKRRIRKGSLTRKHLCALCG